MQNTIKNQEIMIIELELLKNKTNEELEDLKTQVGFKTEKLNEWKQKYEVNKFNFFSINTLIMCLKFK